MKTVRSSPGSVFDDIFDDDIYGASASETVDVDGADKGVEITVLELLHAGAGIEVKQLHA